MSNNMSSYIQGHTDDVTKEKIHTLLAQRLAKGKRQENTIKMCHLTQYDVSPIQARMLEHEEMDDTVGTYNLASAVDISGRLDMSALEQALNSLIASNSALRTRFVKAGQGYCQQIEETARLTPEYISLLDGGETDAEDIIAARTLEKMQLDSAPLMRVTVMQTAPEQYIMLLVTHHAVTDGWSFGVIIHQLQEYYNAYLEHGSIQPAQERVSYIDYTVWRQSQASDVGDYWKKELDGAPILKLECDGERKVQTSYQGKRYHFSLNQDLVDAVRKLAQEHKVTVSNVVMAAYQIMLSKYTQQADFVVGMAVAGREHLAVRQAIGCFVQTLAMHAVVDDSLSVVEYLERVQQQFYDIMAHKEADLYRCLGEIRYEMDNRFPPLFQVMFNFENTPKTQFNFHGLDIHTREVGTCNALFDLSLSVFDTGREMKGVIEYKSQLFRAARIQQMVQCLCNVLASMAAHPEGRIWEISLLSPEQEMKLIEANVTQGGTRELFMERFARVVSRYAERTAVYMDGCTLTYAQLDVESRRVAEQLGKQVRPKSLIGVFMDKSVEAIVSILAIFRAGMVYVPIDIGYPQERVEYILGDANIDTVLTCRTCAESMDLRAMGVKNLNYIEELLDAPQAAEEGCPPVEVSPEDNAYIIYTSGSTGRPKGVLVPHRGLSNVAEEQRKWFEVDEHSRVLQFSSLCFDASIFDIIMALCNGAALYLVRKEIVLGNLMADYIKCHGITHICVTPSVLALAPPEGLDMLQTILAAGEACPEELVEVWGHEHKFFNAYGPTEATIWSTIARCHPGEKVTIGKPINQVEVYVLDRQLNLVPRGCEGELYIGGIGLCNGYLNREDLNSEKFISKRFSNGYETCLYVSGDMVRWNEDGNLEFLGRKDNQVKLRGFRVETDEIRAKILEFPGVLDVVIGVIKKGGTDVLYAVMKSQAEGEQTQALKEYLQKKLPYYMVPTVFQFVSEIPLTWNGKVDVVSMERDLALHVQKDAGVVLEPQTEIQRRLLDIWKQVLEMDTIGTDENFFSLGGHSLTATKLANGISEAFQVSFATGMVFSHPTILEMEESLQHAMAEHSCPITRVERTEKLRLAPQQRQLWVTEHLYPGNDSYHIVTPIRLKGAVDVSALEQSFRYVIQTHEILRVNLDSDGGVPYQTIREQVDFRLHQVRLLDFEPQRAEKMAQSIINMFSKRTFDLSKDLLLRGLLIRLSQDESILVIMTHHVISDGWSMELLTRDLARAYNGRVRQETAAPQGDGQDKPEYIDYVYWLETQAEKLERQKQFWREALSQPMDVVSLPTDFQRPEMQTHHGYTVEMELDQQATKNIKAFCTQQKVTAFMLMLTSFSILLHKLTGNSDVPIGVPVAGRSSKELEEMMGFFVNTLVMRCEVTGERPVLEYLDYVRQVSLAAFEHQDVPFEELVLMFCRNRDTSRSPLVQVMLNVQNPDGIQIQMDGLEAAPYPLIQESTKFDITLYVQEYLGKMTFRLVYNSDLFKQERMEELLRQFSDVVNRVMDKPTACIDEISLQSQAFARVLEHHAPQMLPVRSQGAQSLDVLVAESARKHGDKIAVVDGSQALTYRELDATAERLACALTQRGIAKGDTVLVYGVRGVKLVVSMLAILKAGAAFCIFDGEYPEERLKLQFQAVQAAGAVVIGGQIPQHIQFMAEGLKVFDTYQSLMECVGADAVCPPVEKDSGDTAYVLFTSGTTGTPNCVSTAHAPVIHFLQWFTYHYRLDQNCVFGLFAGLSHDPLLREVFTPLSVGGRLAIQNQGSRYDWENATKWINEHGIKQINITPSLLMMITEGQDVSLPGVHNYFFGGEGVTAAHIQRVRKISPQASCANFYGATETPQVMGYYDIPMDFDVEKRRIPLQGGIDEVRLYIVNEKGMETGVGELGEIYIETPHLSQGYVNNEALNREKFIPSPTRPGWKIYRTGDMGRYQSDGTIVIEGRKDHQINVRGYRVETREIETALMKHSNVSQAVVCLKPIHGQDQLVAYLVVYDATDFHVDEMRRFLTTYLPANVLPERYALLDQIPLTPNGKVDYRKLPENFQVRTAAFVEPSNDTQRKIAEIWSRVLQSDQFGCEDNFFDVGGHSLLLAQMEVLLEQEFQVELKLVDLFSYPTIAMLGRYIQEMRGPEKAEVPLRTEEVQERAKKRHQSFAKFKRARE